MKYEKGFSLLEVLIALLIISIIAASLGVGLSTAFSSVAVSDTQETARTLAELQMEHVKNRLYSSSYSPAPIPVEYPNYSAAITVNEITDRDTDIQNIQVTISYRGKPIIATANCTLEGYKVK